MLRIIITPQVVGQGLLYEFKGHQGRSLMVPTYKVVTINDRNEMFEFAVTRDASDHFFLEENLERYGPRSECPPSRPQEPYYGRIREDGELGFRLVLFEPSCPRQETLRGRGPVTRKHIVIHSGPARSEGCPIIAGGDDGHREFEKGLRSLIDGRDIPILVTVHERQL